ncbi:MAG: putative hypoxanthine oxidase XdhD [Candidatus Rifleibacterium amylolyticum]|nr:MAG: putative hypoxanthine oxidase XdhD [Candidatus Rifleibacterium amylolyticum]
MAKTTKKETVKKAKPAVKPAVVEASPIPESPLFFERPDKFNQVNHSLTKIDAMGLVCGMQKYVDDIDLPGMLYVKVLGSIYAHAEIKSIDTSVAMKVPGVVAIYTWKDVPRVPRTTAGQGYPEPSPYDTYLLDSKVRFVGDRVAIVAAETAEAAEEACKKIKVDYKVLKPVFDCEKAMDKDAPVIHDEKDCRVPIPIFYDPKHNHCSHVQTAVGDVNKGYENADYVLERKYYPHYAQHTPIEPHICIAYLDENDRLVLRTSTQVPFHSRRITAQTLDIPVKKIRVIKPRIGGGFGTKQEVLLEDVCGLVTLRTRRPCVWALTRAEEFMAARTRHPMVVTIKSGVKKDGTITAISMRVLSNTGAYGSHALTVLSNCGSKVLPLYRADNIEFIGDTVYTNLPVGGAYRGYGATQAAYAMECQMDEMAEVIGMDPIKFRQKNHIKEGESSPIFKALGEGREGVDMSIGSCGLDKCITEGMKRIDWAKKYGKQGTGTKRRGLGMCCLMQGSSIPEIDMGAVFIKMNDDGSFNMLLGATDLGTGSDTVLAQIAAETIGCQLSDMLVYSSDTDMTPFDVGAYASSTTYLTGGAVINCAKKVREQIEAVAASMMGEKMSDITIENGVCYGKGRKNKVNFGQVCRYALYEHKQFQIGALGSHISHASPPPFSAHFAEVEVDTETGEVKLLKYVAGVDCGTAINPTLADGQTQGAVMNSISFALTEEYIFDENGRMLNPNFGNYKIWGTRDLPELETFLVPTYEKTGPYGAKSVSEISINGALPAIGNAIKNAVGVRLTHPPFTAEKVLKALKELKAGKKDTTVKAVTKSAKAAKPAARAAKPATKTATAKPAAKKTVKTAKTVAAPKKAARPAKVAKPAPARKATKRK